MATYAHVLDELQASEMEKTKDVLLKLAQKVAVLCSVLCSKSIFPIISIPYLQKQKTA